MDCDPLASNGIRSCDEPILLSPWQSPPEQPRLAGGEVELWRFRLDLTADEIGRLRQLLTDDEQRRAARLLDPNKSEQFVAARGRLRQILACYLETPAEQIAFDYAEYGKPFLHHAATANLDFNLAHAGCWGVVMVSAAGAVGVDVEQIEPGLERDKVAARYFTDAECACWHRLPAVRRTRGFYRIWTRKEARLKAAGGGFSGSAKMASTQPDAFRLRSFVLAAGYLGACALPPSVMRIRRWVFE